MIAENPEEKSYMMVEIERQEKEDLKREARQKAAVNKLEEAEALPLDINT